MVDHTSNRDSKWVNITFTLGLARHYTELTEEAT